MILSVDGLFGNPTENGTADGMVGMLARNECEVAVEAFIYSRNRGRLVDSITSFFTDRHQNIPN